MSRRLVNLTLDNLDDLASGCRSCVFWELDPPGGERSCARASQLADKQAWVSKTLLEWGSCGQVLYVDGTAVGHVLYAPPAYVPRSLAFPTSPISPDAVLLMTARLAPDRTGAGLGRMLIQGVAREVTRRGIKAIEAFGRAPSLSAGAHSCLLPVDFLLAVGFKTVRPHRHTPRLRLEVKSLVSWREDVESAFERLLGSISAPALGRV
jgi:GNAT superfamily N-acetyltransferase